MCYTYPEWMAKCIEVPTDSYLYLHEYLSSGFNYPKSWYSDIIWC